MIGQGEIWWAGMPKPRRSEPGYRRPVVVIQGNPFNHSRIATVVVVPLTSNTRLAALPGNVLLRSRRTGLPKDSVANVSQVISIDRTLFTERIGRIPKRQLDLIFRGFDILFDR